MHACMYMCMYAAMHLCIYAWRDSHRNLTYISLYTCEKVNQIQWWLAYDIHACLHMLHLCMVLSLFLQNYHKCPLPKVHTNEPPLKRQIASGLVCDSQEPNQPKKRVGQTTIMPAPAKLVDSTRTATEELRSLSRRLRWLLLAMVWLIQIFA